MVCALIYTDMVAGAKKYNMQTKGQQIRNVRAKK